MAGNGLLRCFRSVLHQKIDVFRVLLELQTAIEKVLDVVTTCYGYEKQYLGMGLHIKKSHINTTSKSKVMHANVKSKLKTSFKG